MLHALSKAFFLTLARSPTLASILSRVGLHGSHGLARRFVGGETIEEALQTIRELDAHGFTHTLNHLGEHVVSAEAAGAAARAYLSIIDAVAAAGLECKLSVKLSQIGLEQSPELCLMHLRHLLAGAGRHQGFVRVDMEGSRMLDDTLALVERAWSDGHRNLGVVLQAYLRRTDQDLRRVVAQGIRVRLCKGAYNEPSTIAYRTKADVDTAFVRLTRVLLADGHQPAIATHDPYMLEATRAFAREQHVAPAAFEFQMLYGVRRDLQEALRADGYRVRIYVPFGPEWYPYFMRRLAERPENVQFVVRSLIDEVFSRWRRA